jgi:glycosyltransferase involved in cell wall biosynthesis
MSYEPNVEGVRWFAEHVWPLVRAERPDATFVIVGSDPTPAVRALATREASIEVTGAVPQVQPYLWQAAVSVSPLRVSRGVQNKVLEALAAGLPAVVTPAVHAGLPTTVQPACAVADDPQSWASAVVRHLAQTPHGRRQTAGRADLSELGWERQLRPVRDLLVESTAHA